MDKIAAAMAKRARGEVVNVIIGHPLDPSSSRKMEETLRRHGLRMDKVYHTCLPPWFGVAFGAKRIMFVDMWPAVDSRGRKFALT